MSIMIEEEIELINDIITSAIYHGGDPGGAYFSDWYGLESAIGEWLNARELTDLYTPYNDEIVSISKVSLCNLSNDEDIWYLRIPAFDLKGKRIGASQKWQEIQREGLQAQRPGVKFQLFCGRKEKLPFRFPQEEEECVVAIDIAGAESDGICEFYQGKEDGSIFVDSIPAKYLSLCRTKAMEVNTILAWSGYEVYYTKSDWSRIIIRNKEGKNIDLYADGHIDSRESLSAELIDSLHEAHDMYWKND